MELKFIGYKKQRFSSIFTAWSLQNGAVDFASLHEGNNNKMYQPASNVVTMQPGPVSYQPPQKDYLVWSIINLICCCLPLGIAALIFSIKTRDATHQNNASLAAKHSGTAKNLNIAATVIGVVVTIIFLILYFVVILHYKPPE
ncbi:dispanin subfamily A member 2b-like [Hyla sarda]|uniref:dispanin subfamily A member 2b-like n=1 Tax=Hyla sarda TaxID=327740 RepID=UPI0024C3E4B5|nr:dispanin subfamily A member 2b-like [Hyla sarda]